MNQQIIKELPTRNVNYIGLGIVGANKRKYTQLLISVYGIVYNFCNLLIYSVVCGV